MKHIWKKDFSSDEIVDKELVETLNTQYQSKAKEFIEAHPNGIETKRISWFITRLAGKILDIGCADGIVELLAARKGFEIVGIDIVAECIEKAKEAVNKEPLEIQKKISLFQAWSEELPFSNYSFDTIIMAETLEHVADPFRTLEECHRVLANGGQILISVPNGNCCFPSHFRHYTKESLIEQVSKYFKCSIDDLAETKRWLFLKAKK